MTKKRVVAYFMHENEQAEATKILEDPISTQSFVLGTIDESEIEVLQKKGLIVSAIPDVPPEPIDELLSVNKGIAAPQAGIERDNVESIIPLHYTAQLSGPLIETWQSELSKAGANVMEAVGSNRFNLIVKKEDYSNVSKLSFITRLQPLSAGLSDPQLLPVPRTRDGVSDFSEFAIHDIRLRNPDGFGAVQTWLEDRGIRVVGSSRRKIRVFLEVNGAEWLELGALPEVHRVEEYIAPELCNDRARQLVGLDRDDGTDQINLSGAGEVIAVADSGLDEQHPDFAGRVRGIVAMARVGDASDLHGHGTHVAGTALGDGSGSAGAFKGSAPGAELFFQSIMDRRNRLTGLPLDLNDLFQEAYDNGARIHNNSWGADVQARYTLDAVEVDEFARENLDMTIVVAAGNEGSSEAPANADPGFVDWMSVGAPATSKNALTVGASRSDRVDGGYADLTFGEVWPQQFPNAPIKDEKTSGDPESLAAFSSRGPCADRRIKPDLVAPGTNIVSAKSSRAPLRNYWGLFPDHSGQYAYMGGTSMATPLVSGCAALVREFYQTTHAHNASSALVKATLINGTRWLSGVDATARPQNQPNFHQGFGCLNMPTTLPSDLEDDLELRFIDDWQSGALNFNVPGQRYRFEIDTNGEREMRLCLVWTDFPANALQNNLNLFVQRQPNGRKHMGNEGLPFALRLPDEENNVEIIRLSANGPQTLLIQISSGNLLHPGQAFALVVTGDGLSNFRRR